MGVLVVRCRTGRPSGLRTASSRVATADAVPSTERRRNGHARKRRVGTRDRRTHPAGHREVRICAATSAETGCRVTGAPSWSNSWKPVSVDVNPTADVHGVGAVARFGVEGVQGFGERLICRLVHVAFSGCSEPIGRLGSFAQRRGTGRSSTMHGPLCRRVPSGRPAKQRGGTRRAASGLEARRFGCSPRRTSRRTTGTARYGRERAN
jgi:hypothetical protein